MKVNNRTLTKSALSGSILILLLWLLLGTTTTVTWFTDTDDTVNSFVYGNVDVKVEYRKDSRSNWDVVSERTNLFNDEALYEPGYTQVVQLKISNIGNVPFNYRLAVNATDRIIARNYYNQTLCLSEYLKFGVVFADSLTEIENLTSSRELLAERIETEKLSLCRTNSYAPNEATLQPEKVKYVALVVTMPTDVGNEANYHGEEAPYVELGITVLASQLNTIQNIN